MIAKEQRQLNLQPQAHHGGISKIERYNWPAAGDRGVYMELEPGEINIDKRYQRDRLPNNSTIMSIANKFSWVAFGALAVAMRPDGSFWCIDGQGRLMAAMKRADVGTVPCMVFDSLDAEHEAEMFHKINVIRGALTAIEQFAPLAFAGDPVAMKVKELMDSTGYRFSKSQGEGAVKCASMLRRGMAANEGSFRLAWGAAVAICAGGFVHERMIGGLFWLANDNPEHLSDYNTSKLIAAGPAAILKSVQEAVAYEGGGAKAYAKGIVRLLNKGRTTRRIEIA